MTLPGIGSYVALAIKEQNLQAIGCAILAMLFVIIAYDQLLFRPIVAWADKFRFEQTASATAPSSVDARPVSADPRASGPDLSIRGPQPNCLEPADRAPGRSKIRRKPSSQPSRIVDAVWLAFVLACTAYTTWRVYQYLSASLALSDLLGVVGYGFITLIRVIVLIALATLVWVPVGVWIGLRPEPRREDRSRRTVLGRLPRQPRFSGVRGGNCPLRPRPEHLAHRR